MAFAFRSSDPALPATSRCSFAPNPFGLHTCESRFRNPFSLHTYEHRPGGGPQHPTRDARRLRPARTRRAPNPFAMNVYNSRFSNPFRMNVCVTTVGGWGDMLQLKRNPASSCSDFCLARGAGGAILLFQERAYGLFPCPLIPDRALPFAVSPSALATGHWSLATALLC